MASQEDAIDASEQTTRETSSNMLNEKRGQDGAVASHQPTEADGGEKQEEEEEEQQQPQPQQVQRTETSGGALSKDKGPSGGYSDKPIPSRPTGYTLKFTFHSASNLPIADINALSSDPFLVATLDTDTPTRHKEDPPLKFRTPTVRRSQEPVWNEEWTVANVPSSGFKLKLRVYDEDPGDRDDKLGRVNISVPSIQNWSGMKNETHKVQIRGSSIRAYGLQAITCCFKPVKRFHGDLTVSIEVLGRTPDDGQYGRLYTVGPCRWTRHYSPILGRLVRTKEPSESNLDPAPGSSTQTKADAKQKKIERYNFQANEFQLQGPVPAKLYHRFVEFKPWVGRMFNRAGFSGVLLGGALHHQHNRVYNFGRSTRWGHYPQGPCDEMTRKFLDLVHYDKGGRIYTYVLTLDALWRFTETGKEFSIDMLSKHTMHSDVNIYIAFSGEFFIRRLKHAKRPPPPEPVEETSKEQPPEHKRNETHPPDAISEGAPQNESPKDPRYYQLVIDNDSGTYRPNAQMLPLLKEFMTRSLPGLHIMTLDCQADAEKMGRMKDEQRERKKSEGAQIVYTEGDDSSISSSEDEMLNEIQERFEGDDQPREHGVVGQKARDMRRRQKSRLGKAKRTYGRGSKHGDPAEGMDSDEDVEGGEEGNEGEEGVTGQEESTEADAPAQKS